MPHRPLRSLSTLVGLLLVLAALTGPASAARETLVILHTNDTHASFLPEPASWRDDRPLVGGSLALEATVRAERERWRRVLLVDAGDVLTGSPLSEVEAMGAKGGALFGLMGRIGYDAVTLGNHEFDQGAANVDALVRAAAFDVLCANLDRPDGTPYAPAPGRVYSLDGVTVGVVGVITEHLDDLLPLSVLEQVRVHPASESVREWIDALETEPDVLVVLSHMGVEEDEALAAAVPEIDLIVGGHSHTRLEEARVVGTTRIVQAGSRMRELGRVRLEVEDGEIVSFDAELIPLFASGIDVDPRMARLIAGYERQIDKIYGEVIGELVHPWRRRGSSSNIGIWLAEALADGTGSDFGLMNNGGIRSDVGAGPITRLDVAEVLPFHNYVTTFELTGKQLLHVLGLQAKRTADRGRGRMQLGHLTARWAREGGDVVLVEATCRGEVIDPERTYRGASADFVVVSQADYYLEVEPSSVKVLPDLLSTFIEARIREAGRIESVADDRIEEAVAVGTSGR